MIVSVQAVIAASILSLLVLLSNGAARGVEKTVTYDGRSLIINGRREIFFSGSIHYPRSVPEMWPEILQKAKQGGLNVIQTYVFWNIHEPVEGQFNFEGNYDLVKFIKMIDETGMYVTLRIGPFIEAEWNFGYRSSSSNSFSFPLSASKVETYGGLCSGITKTLAVQMNCGRKT